MRRLLLLALLAAPGWACSCSGWPSAKGAWQESPLVFVGVVERTTPKVTDERLMAGEQSAWVRVVEPFKGVEKDQVLELRTTFSSCSGGFRDNGQLLFYLHPGKQAGTWVAYACHRTRALSGAADDLRFLRELPGSARGNRVSGLVQLYDEDPVNGFRLNRALPGVRVRAVSETNSHETSTSAEGLYEFRRLPPGTYTIQVDYPRGMALRFPMFYGMHSQQRLQQRDDARLEVTAESGDGFDFVLAHDTRISGRVLAPDGQPMKDVCVDLEPALTALKMASLVSDCTEPDGTYKLERLSPGSYRVVANREERPTAAAPFGKLYHPGTAEVEKAGLLTVAAGEHLDNVDIRVPELARRIELRGRLTFSDGVPVPHQSLYFREKEEGRPEYGRTDAAGNFTMRILVGRSGHLSSEINVERQEAAACPQFRAGFNPRGYIAGLKSTPAPVAGDKDISGMVVTFPFPSCEEWLKQEAARNSKRN